MALLEKFIPEEFNILHQLKGNVSLVVQRDDPQKQLVIKRIDLRKQNIFIDDI